MQWKNTQNAIVTYTVEQDLLVSLRLGEISSFRDKNDVLAKPNKLKG